jgi:hypothetical protein
MSKIEDLEILKQYLSEDELKSIAKEAAYSLFKSSIGPDNPHRKDNIEYYCKQGALLALKESMTDLDLSELQSEFNAKIKRLVKRIDWYNIHKEFDTMLKTAISTHEDAVKIKVNEVISKKINDDESHDSIYSRCQDSIADAFSGVIYLTMKEHFKEDK